MIEFDFSAVQLSLRKYEHYFKNCKTIIDFTNSIVHFSKKGTKLTFLFGLEDKKRLMAWGNW